MAFALSQFSITLEKFSIVCSGVLATIASAIMLGVRPSLSPNLAILLVRRNIASRRPTMMKVFV